MENVTWLGIVSGILLLSQILNLFNSANTAKKNANAPLDEIRNEMKDARRDITVMQSEIKDLKRDVDHAHEKIRETEGKLEKTTKAQNKAFMALLLWAKSGGQDSSKIDDAINEISEL